MIRAVSTPRSIDSLQLAHVIEEDLERHNITIDGLRVKIAFLVLDLFVRGSSHREDVKEMLLNTERCLQHMSTALMMEKGGNEHQARRIAMLGHDLLDWYKNFIIFTKDMGIPWF